jgi:hypothetical protein
LRRKQNEVASANPTLKIQHVLQEKEWVDPMTNDDYRALTSLIYNHINPYGEFPIDLDKRLPI